MPRNHMNIPIDLSLLGSEYLLQSLEAQIHFMSECQNEPDKLFIFKEKALKMIEEIKRRGVR